MLESQFATLVEPTEDEALVIDISQNADAVLMEATYLDSEKKLADEFYHMTAESAALYAKNNEVKKLLLTHFSERYKDLNIYEKAVDKFYKNAHISHDFDEIEF